MEKIYQWISQAENECDEAMIEDGEDSVMPIFKTGYKAAIDYLKTVIQLMNEAP